MIHEGGKSSFSLDTDQTKIEKQNEEQEGEVLLEFVMQTHVQNFRLCKNIHKFIQNFLLPSQKQTSQP